MFNFLKKLLRRPSLEELAETPDSGVIHDSDFGFISYEPPCDETDEGFWQMFKEWEHPECNAKIACSLIPGDKNGPFESSRTFLLVKRQQLSYLWTLCNPELVKIVNQWYPKLVNAKPNDIYFMSSLAMKNSQGQEWEVSFEAKEDLFWTYATIHLNGNRIINHSIDT